MIEDPIVRTLIVAYLFLAAVDAVFFVRRTGRFMSLWGRGWGFSMWSFWVGYGLLAVGSGVIVGPWRLGRRLWRKFRVGLKRCVDCDDLVRDHGFECPACGVMQPPDDHGMPSMICCEGLHSPTLLVEFMRSRVCKRDFAPWAFDKCERCELERREHHRSCPVCGKTRPHAEWLCCELTRPDQYWESLEKRPCPDGAGVFVGPLMRPQVIKQLSPRMRPVLTPVFGVDGDEDDVPLEELAQIGYEAYGDKADWKSHDGRPMPRWDELPEVIRERWVVAAAAILDESEPRPPSPNFGSGCRAAEK